MIKYVEGDLFENIPVTATQNLGDQVTVIAHVVNLLGKWGAGFVIPLAEHYPKMKEAYLAWYAQKGERAPEVKWQPPFVLGQTQLVQLDCNLYGANMLAQTLGGERPLFYNSLASAMDRVLFQLSHHSKLHIICPMFGAGLAGGDWNFVEKLIEDCWLRFTVANRHQGVDVTVCYLPQFLPDNWRPPK